MRTLIILLVFGLTSRGFAQTGKLFRGTLNSTKITVYLEGLDVGTNADPIVGAYRYENRKGYLLLNGYRNADGNIILVEQDTPNFSGIFFGSLSDNQISGKWTSADQKFSYPFKIRALTAKDSDLHQFQAAMAAKAQQFIAY